MHTRLVFSVLAFTVGCGGNVVFGPDQGSGGGSTSSVDEGSSGSLTGSSGSGQSGSGQSGSGSSGSGAGGSAQTGSSGSGSETTTATSGTGSTGSGSTVLPIDCFGDTCDAQTEACCANQSSASCIPAANDCGGFLLHCTDSGACPAGQVCCAHGFGPGGNPPVAECSDSCGGGGGMGGGGLQLCSSDAECGPNKHCSPGPAGLLVCHNNGGGGPGMGGGGQPGGPGGAQAQAPAG